MRRALALGLILAALAGSADAQTFGWGIIQRLLGGHQPPDIASGGGGGGGGGSGNTFFIPDGAELMLAAATF